MKQFPNVWGILLVLAFRLRSTPARITDEPSSMETIMAVEDHPLYEKWRAVLERVIEAKGKRDGCTQGSPSWTACETEYQKALIAYDSVAREI